MNCPVGLRASRGIRCALPHTASQAKCRVGALRRPARGGRRREGVCHAGRRRQPAGAPEHEDLSEFEAGAVDSLREEESFMDGDFWDDPDVEVGDWDSFDEDETFFFDDDGSALAGIDTGGQPWAEAALQAANEVLDARRGDASTALELHTLRATPGTRRLVLRLDKPSDPYGSPSLDDMESFARDFNARFEASVGETVAGEIEVEVSSPGAERPVVVPEELERFKNLPMRVEFLLDEESGRSDTRVLRVQSWDEELTTWALADTKQHRRESKGRALTRKQRELRLELPVSSIVRVNLFLDV
ncbi:unnamed protein product [Pedinophyceae sp. YPF-701]|nr:unnamed protein product [Pedinophyceae sp. YPF-701]